MSFHVHLSGLVAESCQEVNKEYTEELPVFKLQSRAKSPLLPDLQHSSNAKFINFSIVNEI